MNSIASITGYMEPSDTLQSRTAKSKRERKKVTPDAPQPKIANGSTGLKKGKCVHHYRRAAKARKKGKNN